MGASLTGASCGSRTSLGESFLSEAGASGAVAGDDAPGAAANNGAQGGTGAAGASGPSRAADGSALAEDAGDEATPPPPSLLNPGAPVDSGDAASVDGASRVDACAPIPCCFKYSPTCTCLIVCIQ